MLRPARLNRPVATVSLLRAITLTGRTPQSVVVAREDGLEDDFARRAIIGSLHVVSKPKRQKHPHIAKHHGEFAESYPGEPVVIHGKEAAATGVPPKHFPLRPVQEVVGEFYDEFSGTIRLLATKRSSAGGRCPLQPIRVWQIDAFSELGTEFRGVVLIGGLAAVIIPPREVYLFIRGEARPPDFEAEARPIGYRGDARGEDYFADPHLGK